jgi:hypothetical protein
MKYSMKDISVGDEVYFDSTPSQSNHGLYWTVLQKLEKEERLIVQLDEMGHSDVRWTIKITEVQLSNKVPH